MVLLKGEIDGCFYDVLCVHIHVTHYVNEVENREKCKISHLPPPLMIKFFPSCFHGLFIAPYTLFLSYYSVNSKFWYNRFIRERVLVARGEKKHTREKNPYQSSLSRKKLSLSFDFGFSSHCDEKYEPFFKVRHIFSLACSLFSFLSYQNIIIILILHGEKVFPGLEYQ